MGAPRYQATGCSTGQPINVTMPREVLVSGEFGAIVEGDGAARSLRLTRLPAPLVLPSPVIRRIHVGSPCLSCEILRSMHEGDHTVPPPHTDSQHSLAARIRALRKSLNLSQKRFARLIGVDQSNVSRWESGAVPNDAHILKLAEIARVQPAAFRYDPRAEGELLLATKIPVTTPVVGYVGAGQEVFSHDDHVLGGGLEEVEVPEGVGDDPMVAVRVRGESMHPMRDGWLLFYRRDQHGVPEACLNRLCIVKLAGDGPILVKEVRHGYRSNHFLLTSWNAPPIEDVCLDWAAAVLLIRP